MVEIEVFKALADPTRRAVFERLSEAELSVSQIKDGSGVSQPAISQHLSALKAAGLVMERREGRCAFYRANPAGLAPLVDWATRYGAFWPARIEKLKDVLKGMDQ